MRSTIFVWLFMASCSVALSHPGVGIVMDRRGNVYYTDLKHVWKIAPDGRKSIAVRNVHTHELVLDGEDNLYGEHLRYAGEATNRWWHRIWKLSPGGTVTDLIPERRGFLDDYNDFHFARDAQNNFYWAARGDTTFIRRRSPDGKVTTIAGTKFRDVRWMTVTPDGNVYVTDLHDLVRVSAAGIITVVARRLAERIPSSDRHAVMGLWTDKEGNAYAAVAANRSVKRIAPNGSVVVVAKSKTPWAPSGGLTTPNGDLWILEFSVTNAVRVRRIDRSGQSTVYE